MQPFPHLFAPLKVNDAYTMKNRIICAPTPFTLIACDPKAGEKSFRRLEVRYGEDALR